MPGTFIAFDGPNGVGKSSAMRAVAEVLEAEGREVTITREPGGTPLAEELRELLLDTRHAMDTTTQLLIFNAARRSHLQQVILPRLEQGHIVLCDRYLASSLVFQTLKPDGSDDLDVSDVLAAHKAYCFNQMPDFTVYLRAPQEVRLARIAQRAGSPVDRFEEYADKFDAAAAQRFDRCGDIIGAPHTYIDASAEPKTVASRALCAIYAQLTEDA